MRDKDEIDVLGPVGLGVPVAGFNRLIALVHAAVHAKALAVGFDHITGTVTVCAAAQKLNFHAGLRKLSPQGGPPPHPDAGVGRRLFHSRKGTRSVKQAPLPLAAPPFILCVQIRDAALGPPRSYEGAAMPELQQNIVDDLASVTTESWRYLPHHGRDGGGPGYTQCLEGQLHFAVRAPPAAPRICRNIRMLRK